MPNVPYALVTSGADYVAGWKSAINWIGGWDTPENPNPYFPEDKALRKVFLSHVRPALLQAELEQMYCPNLNKMRKNFKKLYDKNYVILRSAAALSGRSDMFERNSTAGRSNPPADAHNGGSSSRKAEIGRTLTLRSDYGPTDGLSQLKAGRSPSAVGTKSTSAFQSAPRGVEDIICHLCREKVSARSSE